MKRAGLIVFFAFAMIAGLAVTLFSLRAPAPNSEVLITPAPEQTAQAPVQTPAPVQATAAQPAVTPVTAAATPVEPTAEPPSTPALPLSGLVIGLDPGHQAHSNTTQEPIAPGSSETKKGVSSGTSGRFSGVSEHVVNLQVGLLLRDLLEQAGAEVIMTRESADVDITNIERAQLFNEHRVDLGVRLHCNGSDDPSRQGAFMLVPSDEDYPCYDECVRAARLILACYGEVTGMDVARGITYRGDQTGFNWCERPIVNIEMGHMTNEHDDLLLTDAEFQRLMAQGIYEGILAYFN